MRYIKLALAAALFAGCSATPDRDAELELLKEADRAFYRATAEQGVEGWVSAFTDDGVMFRSGELLRGHEAIRELMAPGLNNPGYSLSWDPIHAEISESGDLGYTIGRFESRMVGEAVDSLLGSGSYVSIWRRDADGVWKVVLDIGSPDEGG
jgi:ketosteroid isomerase-like protein